VAMTQETVILQHLMQHGSITSFEAIQLYGVTRLSAIIYTLRHKRGFNIATDFKTVTTRLGVVTSVGIYKLIKGGKDNE